MRNKAKAALELMVQSKQGKKLTPSETVFVEKIAGIEPQEKELVMLKRISELFNVSEKSIHLWRKEKRSGLPEKVNGKEDLTAWRTWFAANPSAGHSKGKPRADRETLLCEKLEVEIAIKKIEHAREVKELVSIGEVGETITRIVSAARSEFLKMISDLPPRLAGLDETAIMEILQSAIFEALDNLSNDMSEHYKPAAN